MYTVTMGSTIFDHYMMTIAPIFLADQYKLDNLVTILFYTTLMELGYKVASAVAGKLWNCVSEWVSKKLCISLCFLISAGLTCALAFSTDS